MCDHHPKPTAPGTSPSCFPRLVARSSAPHAQQTQASPALSSLSEPGPLSSPCLALPRGLLPRPAMTMHILSWELSLLLVHSTCILEQLSVMLQFILMAASLKAQHKLRDKPEFHRTISNLSVPHPSPIPFPLSVPHPTHTHPKREGLGQEA